MDSIVYDGVTYEGDTLKSITYSKVESLSAGALHVNTLTAVVASSDPTIVSFAQNAPLRYLRGGSQVALAYVKEIRTIGPGRYQISATSAIGLLTQMKHRGGVYAGETVAAVVADICGTLPYYIQSNFASIQLYGWLPYVAPNGEDGAKSGSARDNLMRVLFDIGANLRTDAQGILRIENLPTSVQSVFGAGRVYLQNASVLDEAPVTAVTVLEHQYSPGGDTVTLFDGTASGNQTVVFPEPVSGLSASGLTIVESGANYAIVSGTGTLTGQKYVHTTREVTGAVTAAPVENIVRLEDTTLVGVTSSAAVVARLVEYYKHRRTLSLDVRFAFENPGDVLTLYDPFEGEGVSACLASCAVTPSEEIKAKITALVGFLPWQTETFEDVFELLTGSGTWTAPADLPAGTEVQLVLIGGGSGGAKGSAGSAAPSYSVTRSGSTNEIQYKETEKNAAGRGGAAGESGSGGNIFRTSFTASAGDSFAYSCGIGGAGETYGTNTGGAPGTDTTFGTFSSASGAPSDAGYFEPTTQVAYGAKGAPGVAGGDGVGFVSGQLVTPPDIVVDGIAYSPGGRASTTYKEFEGGDWTVAPGAYYGGWRYGYGGGNAYKANGGSASTAANLSISSSAAKLKPAPGGVGASAVAPAAATTYGQGGPGGNGGGGGGAFGDADIATSYKQSLSSHRSASLVSATPAHGGAGSSGGDGAPGCAALYYRRPVAAS